MMLDELKQQIAAFLNRDDLTTQIPTFIALAEAKMRKELLHWSGGEGTFEPLVEGVTHTNALLQEAPDAYLYGSLIASAPFLVEDARLEVWGSLYRAAMEELKANERLIRWPGRLVMRTPGQMSAVVGVDTDYVAIYDDASIPWADTDYVSIYEDAKA